MERISTSWRLFCRTSIPVDRRHCGMRASIIAVFGHGDVMGRIRVFVFVYKGIVLFAEGKDEADGACFVVKEELFFGERYRMRALLRLRDVEHIESNSSHSELVMKEIAREKRAGGIGRG